MKALKKSGILLWSAILLTTMSLLTSSCSDKPTSEAVTEEKEPEVVTEEVKYDVNDVSSIIKAVEMAAGSWDKLWEQKDVEFNYQYLQADGKKDISVERYIFDNEASWARYTTHEVNVMPDAEGEVIQSFNGESASASMDGKIMEDPAAVGLADFLRRANYFWFTMNFKLGNPGTRHEYMGQETVNGKTYDKVSVSYHAEAVGKPQNDVYIVYVNPETKLIDRFLFSLPAFGVNDPVLLMEVGYSDINGLKLPTNRNVYMPNEQGEYPETPSLRQISENVKFNNGFSTEDFVL
ncbi:hypothetical protein FNH22_11100 [Fulvivirga sp. M361]|uniref:DUF6503 family protein n=1 Tax=Fulvivirga sp. M361 TaxID=2594266 RepID=UPI00117A562E|nr:DUF6503 family protein [Fulvivirga sp. M361]TRX59067.1 hypothetical protein FNH22_11100 [Fulvivirga sp. M361]